MTQIFKQEEIDESAEDYSEDLWGDYDNNCTYYSSLKGFEAGVKFAEHRVEEVVIDFAEYLMKLNNQVIKKYTRLKPLDSETGSTLVRDLFKQFLKEREIKK
jgi:hypothetical protein